MEDRRPVCPYCGRKAELFKSSERFYGGRDFGPVWACVLCKAWVGCHNNSKRNFAPKGRLANAALRKAKMEAHKSFDRLWREKVRREGCAVSVARKAAYSWLAGELRIDIKRCHIGMFDIAACMRVVDVCRRFMPNAKR